MWTKILVLVTALSFTPYLTAEQKWGAHVFMASDDGEYWLRLEIVQADSKKGMSFSEKSKYQTCLNSFIYHHYLGQNGKSIQRSITKNISEMVTSTNRCLSEYSEDLPIIQDLIVGDFFEGRHSIKSLYD
jgi:hypothetical protein